VPKKQLGRQIAALRRSKKLTQEKLAEKSGYSVEFISLVERGVNAPSVEGCERIARALHVSLKDLFDF
jgi:transcriptional regulator with XRE-family HTH domain